MAILTQSIFHYIRPNSASLRYLTHLKTVRHVNEVNLNHRGGNDYPVYVINRDCDVKRLKSFDARMKMLKLSYERIIAINCVEPNFDFRPLREEIGESYFGSSSFIKSEVGCFLSHAKAWSAFLESGAELALICEDDAYILTHLPTQGDDFKIPFDADLIFSNCRTGETLLRGSEILSWENLDFNYVPLMEALREVEHNQKLVDSPGTDGYFLTRNGAKAVMKIFREKKITVGPDWFLLINSLSITDWDWFMKLELINPYCGRFSMERPANNHLKTYIMVPSLVSQDSLGTTINRSPTGRIEKLEMF